MDVYPRRRLFGELNLLKSRAVWVSGPAGAGKTYLAASWLATRDDRSIWCHLDDHDTDPGSFFEVLAAALGPNHPLPSPPPDPGDLSAFARRWFDSFFACSAGDIILVLDNYERLPAESPLHRSLRDAFARLPGQARVLVLSRSAPPPAFARLLAHGSLQLLPSSRLRLTLAEARGLARARGARNSQDVARWHAMSDGWAAGLALLVQSGDLERNVLVDYFAEEILARVDPETRGVLVRTAILPYLSEELVNRFLGRDDARALLARLLRSNLFLLPREGEPCLVYHALFRAFLLDRAAELGPELSQLQHRAADLLLERGEVEDAYALYLEAGNVEACAAMLRDQAPAFLAQARLQTVSRWVAALPEAVRARDPWLLYYQAVAALQRDPGASAERLGRAHSMFVAAHDANGLYLVIATAIQAVVLDGRDLRALDRWMEAAEKLPEPTVRAIEARLATSVLVARVFRRGGGESGRAWCSRALELAGAVDPVHRAMTIAYAVLFESLYGKTARARMLVDTSAGQGDDDPIAAGSLELGRALVAFDEADLVSCLGAVDRCIELARSGDGHAWATYALAIGAEGALAARRLDDARRYIDELVRAGAAGDRFAEATAHFLAGWLALLEGDLPRARCSIEVALEWAVDGGVVVSEAVFAHAMAVVEASAGRAESARAHLEKAVGLAHELGATTVLHSAYLLEADLALEEGRPTAARDALARGLKLARETGLFNQLLIPAGRLTRLCIHALREGIEPGHASELIRRHRLAPPAPPLDVPGWPWALEISVLGRCELRRDGVLLESQLQPLRLLQALVVLGGRGVSIGRLVDRLWPEADPESARRSFDTALHRLRRLIGDPTLVSLQRGRLSLDERRVFVDVWAFERLVAEITAPPAEPDSRQAVEERLFELYRGPLAVDEWATFSFAPRERLHQRFLEQVVALGLARERRGELGRAVELYRRALEIDSLDEVVLTRLLSALEGLGRRSEALRLYEVARATMESSLGLRPSPEMTAVYERLRRGRSAS